VIHKVDKTLSRPARVADKDTDNDNVNDAGAMWTPDSNDNPDPNNDEIFRDRTITVKVVEKTASGYKVRIKVGTSA
jgi:hypothetical protein